MTEASTTPSQDTRLALAAARSLLERAGIDVSDECLEDSLSTLGWELGDGAYTYEGGMAALVDRALELSRNHTVHGADITIEESVDEAGPRIHLVVANEFEDGNERLPRMFAALSAVEARELGEQLIRQSDEAERVWSEAYSDMD